jgi:hypothetical protein
MTIASFLTHAACLLVGVVIGVFGCALCVARSRSTRED